MQLGLVGLGKMGANMRDRLRAAGVEVLGFARSAGTRDVDSLAELADRLSTPRTVWIMVPAGDPTRDTVTQLAGLLMAGDLVVDGGNSRYTEDQVHAELLARSGIGAALFARFTSPQADSPAMRAVAALHQQFGGHAVRQASPDSAG